MANPLDNILPVENRDDGVYIKVDRSAKKELLLKSILNSLQSAQVINFDPDKIKDVVERGRGAFEKIGPLFAFYNEDLEKFFTLEKSDLSAMFTVDSELMTEGVKLNAGIIRFFLKRKGIVFGILDKEIHRIVEERIFDTPVEIAKGRAPVPGEDGGIEYLVEIDHSTKPEMLADGSVDFRNIKSFTQVAEGAVIAQKTSPTSGTPGMTVSGSEIPAQPGEDYFLREGENVIVSEDGLQLLVEKSGVIYEEDGLLKVKEKLEIPGDVDFNVGNVTFSGSILIKGNVHPEFIVESDSDIEILGEVEAATIRSTKGTVKIHRGVLGKDEGYVYGGKGIQVTFAQNAQLESEGTISIERSCLHCKCVCNEFETLRSDATVIGGQIEAYSDVKIAHIGSDEGVVTKVFLVDKEKRIMMGKKKDLLELREKLEKKMLPVQKELSSKAAILKKAGDLVTDRMRGELKKMIDALNTIKMKMDYVNKMIEKVDTVLNNTKQVSGKIEINGDIYPGTVFSVFGVVKSVQEKMSHKKIYTQNYCVEIGGLS